MNAIDIIILICFIPAIVQGFTKGLISQLSALVSIFLGAWLSFKFANLVCNWLQPYIEVQEQVLYIIAFVLIMIVVIICLYLIGRLIGSLIKLVMLDWLDKMLGVVFALLKATFFIGLFIILFNTINIKFNIVSEEILSRSVLYSTIKDFAYTIFPYFKELLMKP